MLHIHGIHDSEGVVIRPFVTFADLARIFAVSKRTIARWCKSGDLPMPAKIGRCKRWRWEDIEEAVNHPGSGDARTN